MKNKVARRLGGGEGRDGVVSWLRDVVLSFNHDGSMLAIVSGPSRIKVWDVAAGVLKVELSPAASPPSGTSAVGTANGHVAEQYSCIAWGARAGPSLSTKETSKGGKKIQQKQDFVEKELLVTGTSTGDVVAWDVSMGEVLWRAADLHQGNVASLAFTPTGAALYSAGVDGYICEVDPAFGHQLARFRGSKKPLSCIAISPDGMQLLVASSELKLLDIQSRKRIAKFPGHASAVKTMAFLSDGSHFFSVGVGERQVVIWNCRSSATADDENGSNTESQGSLSMQQAAVAVAVSSVSKSGGEAPLSLAAIAENGDLYAWRGSNVADLVRADPVRVTVPAAATAERERHGQSSIAKKLSEYILAAKFLRGKEANLALAGRESTGSLLLARGTKAKPSFERIDISNHSQDRAGSGEGNVITLSRASRTLLVSAGGDASAGDSDTHRAEKQAAKAKAGSHASRSPATVLGPGSIFQEGGAALLTHVAVGDEGQLAAGNASTKKKKKKRKAEEEEEQKAAERDIGKGDGNHLPLPGGGSDHGGGGGGASDAGKHRTGKGGTDLGGPVAATADSMDVDKEPTLGERLAAMGIGMDGQLAPKQDEGEAEDEGQKRGSGQVWKKTDIPKAGSLYVLLQQALQADDSILLEKCLGVGDEKLIANTVAPLRGMEALKFLQVAIAKFQSRPSRATMLLPWLRAVLQRHAAFLMSSPHAQPSLAMLFQLIDARITTMRPMLELSGRLDFLVSCMRSQGDRASAAADPSWEPVASTTSVFDEDDEEEGETAEVEDVTTVVDDSEDDEEDVSKQQKSQKDDEDDEWETDNDGMGEQDEQVDEEDDAMDADDDENEEDGDV